MEGNGREGGEGREGKGRGKGLGLGTPQNLYAAYAHPHGSRQSINILTVNKRIMFIV
jgi:hypothetical protein